MRRCSWTSRSEGCTGHERPPAVLASTEVRDKILLRFEFLSEDRLEGGHILDLKATNVTAQLHLDNNVHLALPETPSFLRADLSGDPAEALAKAENKHA